MPPPALHEKSGAPGVATTGGAAASALPRSSITPSTSGSSRRLGLAHIALDVAPLSCQKDHAGSRPVIP